MIWTDFTLRFHLAIPLPRSNSPFISSSHPLDCIESNYYSSIDLFRLELAPESSIRFASLFNFSHNKLSKSILFCHRYCPVRIRLPIYNGRDTSEALIAFRKLTASLQRRPLPWLFNFQRLKKFARFMSRVQSAMRATEKNRMQPLRLHLESEMRVSH